jgi:hypothetical protein
MCLLSNALLSNALLSNALLCSTLMARATKQTARMWTGGKAPWKTPSMDADMKV